MSRKKTIAILLAGAFLTALIGVVLLALALSAPYSGAAEAPSPADSLYPGTYHLGSGVNDPNGPSHYVLELRADGTASNTTYPTDPAAPVRVHQGRWAVVDGQAVLTLTERDGAPLDEPLRIVFVYRDLFLVAVEHPFRTG